MITMLWFLALYAVAMTAWNVFLMRLLDVAKADVRRLTSPQRGGGAS